MDLYVNRILNITNSDCDEYDIKKDIIENLELIFELYCDTCDTRLHNVYLKYYLENYIRLMNYEKILIHNI